MIEEMNDNIKKGENVLLNMGYVIALTIIIILIILLSIMSVFAYDVRVQKGLNESKITGVLKYVEVPSNVHTLNFYSREWDNKCGLYNFGGRIQVNLAEKCGGYNFEWILKHEFNHATFFQQWASKPNKSCYTRECWEKVAEGDAS